MKFYFFKSTNEKDSNNYITIITKSMNRAFILAHNYFVKNHYKGEPEMLLIQ